MKFTCFCARFPIPLGGFFFKVPLIGAQPAHLLPVSYAFFTVFSLNIRQYTQENPRRGMPCKTGTKNKAVSD
ncbi:MAG: hypothetical protein Q4E38_04810 [Eubacteriales bacterium]|nr:hypothetical protein [Eubacteriales bacterium]